MQSKLSKRALAWIDAVRLRVLALFAAAIIVAFALPLWWWQGLHYALDGKPVSFANCIYFSIVTFTSLGYGDIVPIGFGKALASTEVLLGLAFLGIAIAKLSSAKQSYHLGQLYARDAEERLNQYVIELRSFRRLYTDAIAMLKNGKETSSSLRTLHMNARVLLLKIDTYLQFEINNGDLLNEMPIGPIVRLLKTSMQLVILAAEAANLRDSLHSEQQRNHAKQLVLKMREIAARVSQNCADRALSCEAAALSMKCDTAYKALETGSAAVAERRRKQREIWEAQHKKANASEHSLTPAQKEPSVE